MAGIAAHNILCSSFFIGFEVLASFSHGLLGSKALLFLIGRFAYGLSASQRCPFTKAWDEALGFQ